MYAIQNDFYWSNFLFLKRNITTASALASKSEVKRQELLLTGLSAELARAQPRLNWNVLIFEVLGEIVKPRLQIKTFKSSLDWARVKKTPRKINRKNLIKSHVQIPWRGKDGPHGLIWI